MRGRRAQHMKKPEVRGGTSGSDEGEMSDHLARESGPPGSAVDQLSVLVPVPESSGAVSVDGGTR